jgi:hypothetical protein
MARGVALRLSWLVVFGICLPTVACNGILGIEEGGKAANSGAANSLGGTENNAAGIHSGGRAEDGPSGAGGQSASAAGQAGQAGDAQAGRGGAQAGGANSAGDAGQAGADSLAGAGGTSGGNASGAAGSGGTPDIGPVCRRVEETKKDSVTGNFWFPVYYCHNDKGDPVFDKAGVSAQISSMQSEDTWFVCYKHGEPHKGGNDIWYYTLGDGWLEGWKERLGWGYMAAYDVESGVHPVPGMRECPSGEKGTP